MIYLTNSFSLGMIQDSEITLKVSELGIETVKNLLKGQFTSAVGHTSTAEVLKSLLDIEVPSNRVSIKLVKNDTLIVFQLLVRIEEGKILSREEILKLPFKFYLVEVL